MAIGGGLNSLIPSRDPNKPVGGLDAGERAIHPQTAQPAVSQQGRSFSPQNVADAIEEKVEKLEAVPEINAPEVLAEIDPVQAIPEIQAPAYIQVQPVVSAVLSNESVNNVPHSGVADPARNTAPAENDLYNNAVRHSDTGEPIKEIYKEIDEQDVPAGIDPVKYPQLEEDEFYVRKPAAHRKHFVGDAIFHIEVDKIKPNPYQPRKQFDEESLRDLSNSIREFGVLQPLMVSKIQTETETGTDVEYQLIAGERRLRAAKMAGLERVPVTITQTGEQKEHLEIAIIENLQRSDLDLIETARAYARLQDEFRLTQREVALRLGKSREAIANTLRLLSLPSEIQDALSQNRINESQARLLLSVENPVMQKQLFQDLLVNNLSVRDLRNKIRMTAQPNPPAGGESAKTFANNSKAYEMQALEQKLKDVLGTDVKIDSKGEGGKIVISFYSPEEVYGLIHKINPSGD